VAGDRRAGPAVGSGASQDRKPNIGARGGFPAAGDVRGPAGAGRVSSPSTGEGRAVRDIWVRFGEGMLVSRNAGQRRIYWQGPSLGFDLGGDGGRTMMLVYNLPAAEALFGQGLHTRFVGLNGSAYVVGGFGFTAAMSTRWWWFRSALALARGSG
jgi:hypothetical protein